MKPTIDSKYIQQHLANERTYLAWIRTALAIIGIGFLIVNLHYTTMSSANSGVIVQTIGISSVILGLIIIVYATYSYLVKRRQINDQTFQPTNRIVWLVSVFTIIIAGLFFTYFMSI